MYIVYLMTFVTSVDTNQPAQSDHSDLSTLVTNYLSFKHSISEVHRLIRLIWVYADCLCHKINFYKEGFNDNFII